MKIRELKSTRERRAAAALMAASDPWLELGLTRAHCLGALAAPYRKTYAALDRGEIAGLVAIAMYGTFKGYIQALFVTEGFRGKGLGGELMGFAEEKIFSRSPNAFLCVSSFNGGALRFYRRLGYKKAGLLKDFVKEGSDELLLRKTKGPLLSYRPPRNKRTL